MSVKKLLEIVEMKEEGVTVSDIKVLICESSWLFRFVILNNLKIFKRFLKFKRYLKDLHSKQR